MGALDFSTKQMVSVYFTTGAKEEVVALVKPRLETLGNRLFLVGQNHDSRLQGVETGVAWDTVVRFNCQ